MTTMLGRLLLPLLLAAAALGAWLASGWLGDLTVDQAQAPAVETAQTPLVSVARLPEVARASQRTAAQQAAIDALPAPNASLACAAVYLDGELVWSINADAALIPGFAQLAVTGHAAIETLGADYRFETRAMSAASLDENGVLNASLYVVGSGDPVLMTYNYARSFRPIQSTYTPIESLADALLDAGLAQVNGSVIGVERRFDQARVVSGLPDAIVASGLVGSASALQLDDGLAERPGANGGVAILADEPATIAAEVFDDILTEREVRIGAAPRAASADDELPELEVVAAVQSPELQSIVFQMLAVNDASAAEMLVKELGVQQSGIGSAQAGGEAIVRTAETLGIDLSVAPRGGSGLDPVSFGSCREIGGFVAAIDPGSPTIDALPGHALPGVYGGDLADVALQADFGVVGGRIGEIASFVGRTTDPGLDITVVSIVNRASGARLSDTNYHRELLSAADALRNVFEAPEGDGQ